MDLRGDHSSLPEQDTVTITIADTQDRVSRIKRTTLGPNKMHTYRLKKLTEPAANG